MKITPWWVNHGVILWENCPFKYYMCGFLRRDVKQVTHCVAGNSEGFHAGSRHGGVLGLSVQMLEPVLQILFAIADHLKSLKHASCWMDRINLINLDDQKHLTVSWTQKICQFVLTWEFKSIVMTFTVF